MNFVMGSWHCVCPWSGLTAGMRTGKRADPVCSAEGGHCHMQLEMLGDV